MASGDVLGEGNCTCSLLSEKYWTTHYGSVDPATQWQWDPQCPVHGDTADFPDIKEPENA